MKRKKPKSGKPKLPRNPFAGRPKSGAGFHSGIKYGKKNRRYQKQQIEESQDES